MRNRNNKMNIKGRNSVGRERNLQLQGLLEEKRGAPKEENMPR